MKQIKTIFAIFLLALSSYSWSGSYTQSFATSWNNGSAVTATHNVTNTSNSEIITAKDANTGGLSGGCGSNCGSADNKTSWNSKKVINTNLTIIDKGTAAETFAGDSCVSSINVNGLNATEGWSNSTTSKVAVNNINATGTVSTTETINSISTNNGAEIGNSTVVNTSVLNINESVDRTVNSGSSTRSFTSSLGQ